MGSVEWVGVRGTGFSFKGMGFRNGAGTFST